MKRSPLFFIGIILVLGLLFWWYQSHQTPIIEIPETIVVGTSADFPPFSLKQDSTIVGFDIDVVTEAVKRLGKKIEIKDMPFELLMPQVQLGTVHVLAAGLTETPQRAKRVFFTPAYLLGDPLVAVTLATQKPVTSFDEIKNKKVIVNQGYTADLYMSKVPDIELIRLPALPDALLALRSGKGDLLVTAATTLKPLIEQYGSQEFSLFVIEDAQENMALAISKYYPKLAAELSSVIEQMLEDGTINQLQEKWKIV